MSCLARPVPHRYGWNEGGEKKLNGKTLKECLACNIKPVGKGTDDKTCRSREAREALKQDALSSVGLL